MTGPVGTTTTGSTYDADGNTTTLGSQTLTWTDDSKLATDTTSAGKTTYAYDADGNLLLAHDPTQTTIYLFGGAQQVTLTTSGSGSGDISANRALTLPGGGEAVRTGTASATSTTTSYCLEITDQHGTGVLTLNSSATDPTWRQFDPFGNPRGTAPADWPAPDNAFLGLPEDPNTGLDILGARNYEPAAGRFISIDPPLESSSPQQLNGYTYAADNPVNDSDPSGDIAVGPGSSDCSTGTEYLTQCGGNGTGDTGSNGSGDGGTTGSTGGGGTTGSTGISDGGCSSYGRGACLSKAERSVLTEPSESLWGLFNEGANWLDAELGLDSAMSCVTGPTVGGGGGASRA